MRKSLGFSFLSCVLLIGAIAADLVHAETKGSVNDPGELEAFFDAYLGERMATEHIAGAVVSVVKDGRAVLSKGYGWADVEKRIPTDPERTLITLGSLSKLFAWTAVMQLVEQGKIDLEADINSYLDFTIPATFSRPITMNQLMAHTSGFEDVKYGQMSDVGKPAPLGEWLKTHVPARVRAGGRYSAYGNYGAALAGYIVERVSHMKYDDYIEKNILSPLGMSHSTSRQPVPASLAEGLSQCYVFADGAFRSQPVLGGLTPNVAPAASIRSSATDMARFMLAHLENGDLGGGGILRSGTARLMHQRSFSHAPQVNGMAHGFWELDMNGRRVIGHAGSHPVFNSLLLLFPDDDLGIFIATNSRGGSAFIGENFTVFPQTFVDRFFPVEKRPLVPPADFPDRAARFTGSYRLTYGRSETTPEKLLSLMMTLKIRTTRDGLRLSLPSGHADFIEEAPLVFRQTVTDAPLVFRANANGAITEAFYGPIPLTALIRCRWFETPIFNLGLLAFYLTLFLGCLIYFPAALFLRRPAPISRIERTARLTAGIGSLAGLGTLFCAAVSLLDIYHLYAGSLPLWPAEQICAVVMAFSAVGMVVFSGLVWRRRFRTIAARVLYTLVAVAAVVFVVFLRVWNLIGVSW